MKIFLLSFFLLLYFLNSFSQGLNSKNDGYAQLTSSKDTSLIINGIKICDSLNKFHEYEKSLIKSKELLFSAEKINYINGVADIYRSIAYSYKGQGNLYKANDNFLFALKYYEENNNINKVIEMYEIIGVCFDLQNNFQLALKYYLKCLKLKSKTNNPKSFFTLYNNIGCCYIGKTEHDSALLYFHKALDLSETINSKNKLAALYLNIGNVYKEKKDYLNALHWNSKALAYSQNLPNELDKANLYLEIGLDYQLLNKIELANKYIDTAIIYSDKISNILERHEFYTLFIDYYTKAKNYKKANELLVKKMGLKDTLFNEQLAKGNSELIFKYEAIKKDKAIIIKDKELLKQSIISHRKDVTNYFLITFLTFLFIVIVFMRLRIKTKEKTNLMLDIKNKEIEVKSKEIKEQAVLLAKFQTQMNPHFIFNALTGMQASIIAEDYAKSLNQLQKFSKLMRLTLNLSSEEYISIETEIDYINQYISFELDRFVNKFTLSVYIDSEIDSNNTHIPPMLIQPIIENSIKHAGLNKISNGNININISLIEHSTNIYLLKVIVSDNGFGFNLDLLNRKTNSKGINITKQRIKIATEALPNNIDYFIIDSNTVGINKGTFTTFYLPYKTNLNN
ncbi:MAG: histidine kinase [Bacteroidota bacterium]|nr:histidine kinase [Bacteroidota bacterium]